MMLEKAVAVVLNKILGKYIDGLDADQLHLSLWSGNVTLENLQLKTSSLEEISQLQMFFKKAKIGKLEISIPWFDLRNKPISILIKDVEVIVSPKEKFEWSREKEITLKRAAVQAAENVQPKEKKEVDLNQSVGYFDAFITRIVDNAEIKLQNITIGLENTNPNVEEHPIVSFGMTLEELSIYSSDENFTRPEINNNHLLLHKIIELKNFAVYWKEVESQAGENEGNKKTNAIEKDKKNLKNHHSSHYILEPTNIRVNASIRTKARSVMETDDVPKVKAAVKIDRIAVTLTQQKYQEILNVVNYTLGIERRKKYIVFRPQGTVKENPRAWWRFALRCIKAAKEGGANPSPLYLIQHNRDKGNYVKYYKRLRYSGLKVDEELPTDLDTREAGVSKTQFEDIELRLSVDDIVKCRRTAHLELLKEGFYDENWSQQDPKWFDWLPSEIQLDEGDWEVVKQWELRDKSKDQDDEKPLPPDEIQLELDISLPKASIKLKDMAPTIEGEEEETTADGRKIPRVRDVIDLRLKGLDIGLRSFPNSANVKMTLVGFVLKDQYTPHTHFFRLAETADDGNDEKKSFDIFFQYRPLDKPGVDLYLKARTQAFQFIYNRFWLEKVISFFAKSVVPDVVAAQLKQIEESALEKITYLLQSKQVIKVDADIEAPKILIPADVADPETTSLFVDLGRIIIKSSEEKGITIEEFRKQQKKDLPDDERTFPKTATDVMVLPKAEEVIRKEEEGDNSLLFNTYLVLFQSLNLGVTKAHTMLPQNVHSRNVEKGRSDPNQTLTVQQILDRGRDGRDRNPASRDHLVVIENFDINLVAELCTIIDENLPYIRVSGNLPDLKMTLSSKTVQDIIVITTQAVVPDFATAMETEISPEEQKELLQAAKEEKERKRKERQEKKEKKVHIHKEELNQGTLFEGAFSVSSISITLLRDIDTKLGTFTSTLPTEELAVAVISNLGAKVKMLAHEMVVGVTLASFVVEDKITMDGPQFSKLISSKAIFEDVIEETEGEKRDRRRAGNDALPLITINVEMLDHDSDYYDNEEMIISIKLNQLFCTFNRESIVELMQFGMDCLPQEVRKVTMSLKDLKKKEENEGPKIDEDISEEERRENESTVGMVLSLELGSVVVFFNKTGQLFAECGLHTTSVVMKSRTKSMDVTGGVGRISFSDLSPRAPYPDILWMAGDEETISFSFKTFARDGLDFQGYDSEVGAQVNSIKLTYSHKFVNAFIRYLNRMLKMQTVVEKKSPEEEDQEKKDEYKEKKEEKEEKKNQDEAPKMKMKALVKNPKILVPSDFQKDGFLLVDFGHILLHNHFEKDTVHDANVEKIIIEITDLYLQGHTEEDTKDSNNQEKILDNISFKVVVEMISKKGLPQMAVFIDIPKILLNFDDLRFKLLIDLYLQYGAAGDWASLYGEEEEIHTPKAPPKPDNEVTMVIGVNLGTFLLHLSKTVKKQINPALAARMLDKEAVNKAKIKFTEQSSVKLRMGVRDIDKMDRFGLSDPFLVVYRIQGTNPVQIHETEVIQKTLKATFKEFEIPAQGLLEDELLRIECYDWNKLESRHFIGKCEMTLSQLLSTKEFELVNPDKKRKKRNYRNSGHLVINSVKPINASMDLDDDDCNQELEEQENANTGEAQKGMAQNDRVHAEDLALLVLSNMQVKMIMKMDGSMFLDLDYNSLDVRRDQREEKGTSMIKTGELKFKYHMNNEGVMKMAIVLPQTEILINPNFIMPFQLFMMNGINYMNRDLGGRSPTPKKVQDEVEMLSNPGLTHMIMEVQLDSILIYLHEKPDDLTSSKISVGFSVYLKYALVGQVTEMSAKLRGSQVTTQGAKLSELLSPLGVDFNMISNPDFSSIGLRTDPLAIMMSYKDYNIIMGVSNSYTETVKTMTEKGDKLENYNIEPEPLRPVANSAATSGSMGVAPYSLDVNLGATKIVLKSDFDQLPSLLECYVSGMHVEGYYPSQVSAKLLLSCRYYNLARAFWEPCLEPSEIGFNYASNVRGDMFISIQTPKVMEVNATASMAKTLNFWAKKCEKEDEDYHPIIIRNFTSKNLNFKMPVKGKSVEDTVPPGDWRPLRIPFQEVNDLDEFSDSKIDLRVGDFALDKLGILDQSTALFTMVEGSKRPVDKLIYDITFMDNHRVITVRSAMRFINKTVYTIQCCAEVGEGASLLRFVFPHSLEPNQDLSVPPEFVEEGRIYFRPCDGQLKGKNYGWSNPVLISEIQPKRMDLGFTPVDGLESEKQYFRCDITEDEGNFRTKMYTAFVTDPMNLENLLPCEFEYNIVGTDIIGKVGSQEQVSVNDRPASSYPQLRLRVNGSDWCESIGLDDEEGHFMVPEKNRELTLYFERTAKRGIATITFYAKHWIVNRTEFALHIYSSKGATLFSSKQEGTLEDQGKVEDPVDRWHPSWYNLEEVNQSKPFIYSTRPKKKIGNRVEKAYIQLNDSVKSEGIRFDVIEAGEVVIPSKSGNRNFKLGISVRLAEGKMKRTKIVTISPRIMLVNNMGRTLFYQQVGTNEVHELENQQFHPFHWLTAGKEQISISFERGSKWTWSGGLEIKEIGETYLKLTNQSENLEYFVRVDVMLQNSSIMVVQFNPKRLGIYPYRIENQTRARLTVWQEQNENQERVIAPGDHLNYAWDEPSKPHNLVLQFEDTNQPFTCSLDRVEYHRFEGSIYAGEVTIESKTRILWIKDYRSHMAVIDRQSRERSEAQEIKTFFEVSIPQIGVSVVDRHPKELMFISLEKMQLKYTSSLSKTSIDMSIQYMQIDNQLYLTPFPVLLAPNREDKATDGQKFMQLTYMKSNIYETVEFVDALSVMIQHMDVQVDAVLVNSLLHFYQSAVATEETKVSEQKIEVMKDELKKPIYLRLFYICPVRATVSFTYPAYKAEKEDLLKLWVSPLLGSIPNVNNAAFVLKPVWMEHPVYEQEQLMSVLQTHYINAFIRESYKLVGSIDIIANPFKFVGTVAESVKDVLNAGPAKFKAATKGDDDTEEAQDPDEEEGEEKDKEKIEKKREQTHQNAPPEYQHALEIFDRTPGFRENMADGFWELGHGIVGGVSGVVRDPVKGAKKDGALGFLTGIGKGLVGVIKKPVGGIHDFGSRSMKAIAPKDSKRNQEGLHRRRLPRYFGNSRILEPYNLDLAYGQFLLVAISGNAYKAEDCIHNLVFESKIYLVTDFRIVCLNLDDFSIRWQLSHRNIARIEKAMPNLILDEAKYPEICGAHSCEFLEEECRCNIRPETLTGRRFLMETSEREFPMMYAAVFKTWSFWHRTATPEIDFEQRERGVEELVREPYIKRELQFFGAMEVTHKIHQVEKNTFCSDVPLSDKQETTIHKSQGSTTSGEMGPVSAR